LRKNASEKLNIDCVVDSYPLKDGIWNLSGIPIQTSQKVSKTYSVTNFLIPRLRQSDSGVYSCCISDLLECKNVQVVVDGIFLIYNNLINFPKSFWSFRGFNFSRDLENLI
jgi:hypothetical protein